MLLYKYLKEFESTNIIMSSLISNSLRYLLILTCLFPVLALAQATQEPSVFLQNVHTAADYDQLTSEQKAEADQYFKDIATNATMIAEVNLQNIKLVSKQKGGLFDISFELVNGAGVQTGVKYGVSLIRETDQGQIVVDSRVYPEVLTLEENAIKKINITYQAPAGLSGKYKILVQSGTDGGLMLGLGFADDIILAPPLKSLEILTDTCYLQVQDEVGSPHYTLTQGVDITSDETLQLTCTVTNYGSSALTVTPGFETRLRTMFGEVVPSAGGSTGPITFNPNETKNIIINLPKATPPQSYDVQFTLENNELKTNTVTDHYVLIGSSATIQNVILDKTSYQAGESALMSFIWSPSADSFPGSRHEISSLSAVALEISMKDKEQDCIKPEKQTVDPNVVRAEFSLPVTANCAQPVLSLNLTDSQGQVLDTRTLAITQSEQSPSLEKKTFWNLGITSLILFTVSVLILLSAFILKKVRARKYNIIVPIESLILAIVMVGTFLYGAREVEAVTWTIQNNNIGVIGGVHAIWTFTANLNKSVYSPGELTTLTASANMMGCSNAASSPYSLYRNILATSPWNHYLYGLPGLPILSGALGVGMTDFSTTQYAAPGVGSYFAWFNSEVDLWGSLYTGSANIPFTVAACSANAGLVCTVTNACGASNSGTFDCAGACSVGAPALPVGYGNTCSSPANICGMTNTGTIGCGGCSVSTAPADSLCPPTLTFVANPTLIGPGDSSSLDWTVTGATSCTGSGGSEFVGAKAFSGTNHQLVSPLFTTLYSLSCTGSGGTVSRDATVTLPSATLTASPCTIPSGGSSCDSTVAWNSSDFIGGSSVLQDSIQFSTAPNDAGTARPVTLDNRTFTLKDTGSSLSVNALASVSCGASTFWTGSSCLPLPDINISANPKIIRIGETASIDISIMADYDLSCNLYGTASGPFAHTAAATETAYNFTTKPLTSAQIVRVECTATAFPTITGSGEVRVDVVPGVQEI